MDRLKALQPWFLQDEDFMGAWFSKNFADELSTESQSQVSKSENYESLLRIHGLAKQHKMPVTL